MTNKTNMTYNPSEIEAHWQKIWEDTGLFSPNINEAKNPFYNLMMFPYPSAEGLHVGNMYAFTGADVSARFNRMQGKDVFEPIGLDGFGIHSENYALKVGRHPKEQAKLSQENFYRQLHSIGNSFDWKRTVETYDPDYYKWTQWLFIQLFKAGLAYRKKAEVNWCPSCKTVLADEQVLQKSVPGPAALHPRPTASSSTSSDSRRSPGIPRSASPLTTAVCERCGSDVSKKELEQWFFRITKYADRLLNNIEGLNWSEKVKIAQKNWIGKSEGVEIGFVILNESEGSRDSSQPMADQNDNIINVFTTRPDTLFGATFMVVAPEHEIVTKLLNEELSLARPRLARLQEYVEEAKKKTKQERITEGKDPSVSSPQQSSGQAGQGKTGLPDEVLTKSGVFSGLYAINPVNGKKIPVWVADYVLMGYGTGAIMAVPAHDERDFEFAKKYNLPVIPVIANEVKQSEGIAASRSQSSGQAPAPRNDDISEPYEGDGVLINSGEWNGWSVPKDMGKVLEWLEGKGLGTRKSNFHLRDWLISRQRYWGPPIPMIFCEACFKKGKGEREEMSGWFAVPEEDLPVLLPDVEDWRPRSASSGQAAESPLASHPEFYNVACPVCGRDARRETDVSDTFLDSSWYYLRYPSVKDESGMMKNEKFEQINISKGIKSTQQDMVSNSRSHLSSLTSHLPWDPEITSRWLPVDMYIGGAEHAVLHLLYSRFVAMALYDLGFLSFEEPFSTFFAHGLIIKDGAKMSKSKGNVVIPDAYIKKYGADALRAYLMFLGPYEDGGDFRDSGIEGMYKFLRKVWKLLSIVTASPFGLPQGKLRAAVSEIATSHSAGSGQATAPRNDGTERLRIMHKTIQKVTKDIKEFGYNTAIASLMEWYNYLNSGVRVQGLGVSREEVEVYLKLLAPFAPHMTEELWQAINSDSGLQMLDSGIEDKKSIQKSKIKNLKSIHLERWPTFEEKYLVSDVVTIVVQVNGKRRGEIQVQSSKFKVQSEVEEMAKVQVLKYLEGLIIKKTIYVPGKILNFVV